MLRRRFRIEISAKRTQVSDDIRFQEIPVAILLVDAGEFDLRSVLFLDVADDVAAVTDCADIAASFDHLLDESRDFAGFHDPLGRFRHGGLPFGAHDRNRYLARQLEDLLAFEI
jgi:hypothetical protein